MTHVRSPAVAGTFYPGDAATLRAEVEGYLSQATPTGPATHIAPKAIIVPHAGYVYSGPVAAHAYARLAPYADTITRVVVLGPCHRVPVSGVALSTDDAFTTPLGDIAIDHSLDDAVLALGHVMRYDETHTAEHSLEVQLPFLQVVLGDFELVPLVIGSATTEEVADILDTVWGGPETLIVISSDLSHYLPYDDARSIDADTARAIEALNPAAISDIQACGRMPLKGMLTAAKRHHLKAETLDLRNSGDTAGPRDQVVGYGAWALSEEDGA